MSTVFIYALIDPRNQEVRYIGKAANPLKRLKYGHLNELNRFILGKTPGYHKLYWLKQLYDVGLVPKLKILEEVNSTNWQQREIEIIEKFKITNKLTNISKGGLGSGGMSGKKQSNEHKAKIKHSRAWYKPSEETKQKIRDTYHIKKMIRLANLPAEKTPAEKAELRARPHLGNSRRCTLQWILCSPQEEIIKTTNLRRLCSERNLDYGTLMRWRNKVGDTITSPRCQGWTFLSVSQINANMTS